MLLKCTRNALYLLLPYTREDAVVFWHILYAIDIRTTYRKYERLRSERNLPPTHETTGPWFYFVKTPS
jgi:hypothetical protein